MSMTAEPVRALDSSAAHDQRDLSRIYTQRFSNNIEYRRKVWTVLVERFFAKLVPADSTVLDLGCGYGEFINQVAASRRLAMDLNPDASRYLASGIEFIHQDCSLDWPSAARNLDVVFTSNFFEHLPDKAALGRTLDQIYRSLKPDGCLIAMGPNVRCVPGAYWDFWDHYIALTERSLGEALGNRGFEVECSHARFLPYTMVGKKPSSLWLVRAYLALPFVWKIFGQQFLVVARKSKLQVSNK